MSDLFGRKVTLQIGTEGSQGKSFSDIRVSFKVTMDRTSEPNKATIQAYNLNKESIDLLKRSDAVVRILAGYDVPKQIFMGHPLKNGVKLTQTGPDRILQIDAQDGGRQYKDTRIEVSFSTQTSGQQLLDKVVQELGLPVGTVELGRNINFPNGIVFSGMARDLLDRLATMSEADWFIRDGVLQIVEKGGFTRDASPHFSVDAGNLIGTPKPTDTGIEVVGLLEPSLRPGHRFRVTSEYYSGDYVASDVEFMGDSGWDTSYYVTVRGTPL